MLNVSGMFFIASGVSYLMNGKGREIPVTSPERELHWCYYSPSISLACVADALNLMYIASSQTEYTNGFDECVGRLQRRLYFSRFLSNCPRTQSSFDTHARWQPVTSARSRRSYGKIEDFEQSSRVRRALSKQFHEKIGDCEHWLDKLPNSSHCGFRTKVLGCENGK